MLHFCFTQKQLFFEFRLAFKLRAFSITLQWLATPSCYSRRQSAISADFSNAVSNSLTDVLSVVFGVWQLLTVDTHVQHEILAFLSLWEIPEVFLYSLPITRHFLTVVG
jgi:hypothetical protein